ncbi:CHAT domain-containing protein [Micromonospora haikouensis]|uniref:CHAT domain-containing tetratricopeptide repeat protein n=1 Tax=Micromonospora haikouensis TaxID=686309 RepID=UPI00342B9B78
MTGQAPMSCYQYLDRVRRSVRTAAEEQLRLTAMAPRPQVHLFVEGLRQPYVGCVEARAFASGTDAATAIGALGFAAAALPASHLLVVWEQVDLMAALGEPLVGGSSLVVLEATAGDHSLAWYPLPAVVGAGIGSPMRRQAARARHRAPLPAPIDTLLATWRSIHPPDFATTMATFADHGYAFTAATSPPRVTHRPADALDIARSAVGEALATLAPESVDQACRAVRDALAVMPDHDPRRGLYLVDLSQLLQQRYEHGGDLADVTAAVRAARQAGRYPAGDTPARRLDALGTALRIWYEATGDRASLDESIAASAAAVDVLPDHDDNAATCLVNLATVRHVRFRATGDVDDLDQAISDGRRALGWLRPDDRRWAQAAMMLCNFLEARYALTGVLAVLDEAITFGRAAATAPQGVGWMLAAYHANLARTLDARYRRTGELQSLHEAIDAGRTAVAAVPPVHPEHARYQLVLSESLHALFDRTGNLVDLDAAFEASHEATAAVPADHPLRLNHVASLAMLQTQRSRFTTDTSELDDAVGLLREALSEAPSEHPQRPTAQAVLADALRLRAEQTGDTTALNEAVDLARLALDSLSPDHPRRSTMLSILAHALDARRTVNADERDFTEAIDVLRTAAAHRTAAVGPRLDAARAWGDIAVAAGRTDLAAQGLETAVRLLPLRVARGLHRTDAQYWLGRLAGLARDAAALAVAGGSPQRAVELLELGRTVLTSQSLDGRTDLAELRAHDPALADRFDLLSARIESGGEHAAEDRRRWADELDAVVALIRASPGLDRFLLPPVAADLTAGATAGPIVLVNVSPHRCDALLVTPDGIRALPLPDLTSDRLTEVVARFLPAVRDDIPSMFRTRQERGDTIITDTLAWLWDAVAGPVLDALAPAPDDRLWWVPTGPLTLLPLHAAGRPHGPSVLDQCIPSYTPSIRALIHARAAGTSTKSGRTLVVGMPNTPGETDLPAALREAALVAEQAPQARTLIGPQAVSAAVIEGMENSTWAHFACHATTAANPSDSRLLLHDHVTQPLTATGISRLRLRSASLAYLSACDTAVTTTDLADEVIHIASAFHLAGYPRVIGTLWNVRDDAAASIAHDVYAALTAGRADPSRAARALRQAVARLRDEHPDRPSRWASHVHLGL